MARASLIISVALFALGSPLIKWLVEHGGELGVTQPGAISFCNLLFVGNFCGGVLAFILGRPSRIAGSLRKATRRAWWLLFVNVALAVLIPTLFYIALETTTVTKLVLLSRVEPVAFAVFALIVFGTRVGKRQWVGYGVILVGSLGLAIHQAMGEVRKGDLQILAATVLGAYSAVVSKQALELVNQKALAFIRTFFSAIAFFIIAVYLYGWHHFADAFGPGLWLVVSIYALFTVVVAQFLWYRALEDVPAPTIATWLMISPALTVFFSYLLLGEVPTNTQWIAAAIIVVGMLVAREKEPQHEPGHDSPKTLSAAQ